MSKQRCQRETTSREFLDWIVYLDELPNEFNPLYWYLARIALEIRRLFKKNPEKYQLKEFIIPFRREKDDPMKKPFDDDPKEDRRRRNIWSRLFWSGVLGRNLLPKEEDGDG